MLIIGSNIFGLNIEKKREIVADWKEGCQRLPGVRYEK
jgi:hypothetical protein